MRFSVSKRHVARATPRGAHRSAELQIVRPSWASPQLNQGGPNLPGNAARTTGQRPLRIGQPAPKFEAKTLDGKTISLTNYLGKYVLLSFTAKYLGPQQTSEIQILKSVFDTYGKSGNLVVISLSVDNDEKLAKETVTENGITWPFCYLGNWSATQVPARFGVDSLPHSILISPAGTILNKSMSGTYLKTAVRNALESKTASTRQL